MYHSSADLLGSFLPRRITVIPVFRVLSVYCALGDQSGLTFTELGEQRFFSLVNRRTPIIFRRFAVPNEVDGFHVEGDVQAASSMSSETLLHYAEHAG